MSPGDHLNIVDRINHALLKLAAGKIVKDSEEHINVLSGSNLDWTVIRSPIMSNNQNSIYRLDLRPPSPLATIPRRAVAKALVDQLDSYLYLKSSPHIHRSKLN